MLKALSKTKKEILLSSKEAGAQLGYTHDYISKLCREGKMKGTQKGRSWFVTQSEVERFAVKHAQDLKDKNKNLSAKLSHAHSNKKSTKPKSASSHARTPERLLQSNLKARVHKKKTKSFSPERVLALLSMFLIVSIFLQVAYLMQFDTSPSNEYVSHPIITKDQSVEWVSHSGSGQTTPPFEGIKVLQNPYFFFESLSETYLTMYVLQGKIMYNAISDIDLLGAGVIGIYELAGQAVYTGAMDVLKSYTSFFKKSVMGYQYSHSQVGLLVNKIVTFSTEAPYVFVNNLTANLSDVQETFSSTLVNTSNLFTPLASFDFIQDTATVEANVIRLE